MRITVRICGDEATVEDGVWSSANKALETDLRTWTATQSLGPGAGADPDVLLAGLAAKEYRGEILTKLPPPSEGDPTAVY